MAAKNPHQRPAPIEKRKKNRRVLVDRREEVRFEPLKKIAAKISGGDHLIETYGNLLINEL